MCQDVNKSALFQWREKDSKDEPIKINAGGDMCKERNKCGDGTE